MQAYDSVHAVVLRVVDDILDCIDEPSKSENDGKDSFMRSLQDTAQQAVNPLKKDDQWQIYTTGHSMGGALACLCAHELAVRLLPHKRHNIARDMSIALPVSLRYVTSPELTPDCKEVSKYY